MNISAQIKIYFTIMIIALGTLLQSCSTTRRIPEGEILYTGVKKIDIQTPRKDQKQAPGLSSEVLAAVNVKPNNCLYSPYLRYPFPLGLWVYNNWSNPPHGFKHWIYEKLVEQPVLISDVRPDVRVGMIDDILENNGYFSGKASYSLVQGSNKKKAKILYTVQTGPEYLLDSIQLLPDTCKLYHLIDSVAARNSYLKNGSRYCTDSLSQVRTTIANAMRNKGYYFFKPEFIEYLADSTLQPNRIAMRLTLAKNILPLLLESYNTGTITTRLYRNQGDGTPDTTITDKTTLIRMMPSKLRQGLIDECIAFRPGKTLSTRDMNRTQNYLSRLGIFSSIEINVVPDTTKARTLNVEIDCTYDKPWEASIEMNVTSQSNSYLGPGLNFKIANTNVFGGGEQLSAGFNAAYEWQTGHNSSSVFNSYEFGLNTTLAFPRLLVPRFIPRSKRQLNWTRISLNVDVLNRPHYFNLADFNASFAYDWQVTRHVTNTLTLFKLGYIKLIRTTEVFDSVMNANEAIAQSFRNQFIPQMSYTYTYDRAFDSCNSMNFTFTVQEAGNIFWGLYRAFGVDGEKKLFGIPFSQFVKATTQLVYNRRLWGDNWLVGRVAVGAAHAYGNSTQVPYSEQFYVGGANSIRAYTVKSIGPGSYHVDNNNIRGYFDQTGTFKFEFNLEYRFPIFGPVHGAVFFDSGNVWLLRDDPERPGGTLKARSFFKDIATGTGVGLRLDLGMFVLRGDLGVGIHLPYNTGKRGYYNMTKFKDSLAFHLAIGYPF